MYVQSHFLIMSDYGISIPDPSDLPTPSRKQLNENIYRLWEYIRDLQTQIDNLEESVQDLRNKLNDK